MDHQLPARPEREIRLLRASLKGVSVVGRIPNPFTLGFFAVASPTPSELLFSGLLWDRAEHQPPNPHRTELGYGTAASLLLRARVECGADAPVR
ncbi:MAG: hypothetical protein M3418_04570 [Gemmatimonadota bacterium]|nr:hypothetical protein [Gemmatimonadota bacterium]